MYLRHAATLFFFTFKYFIKTTYFNLQDTYLIFPIDLINLFNNNIIG